MLDEIATLLKGHGIPEVYKAKMPDSPDGVVTLYEYAGRPPEFSHGALLFENPGLQAVSRDKSYAAARDRIEAVSRLLNGRVNQIIGEHVYLRIMALQSPMPIGTDESDRPRIAVNFEVARGGI